MFTQISRRGFGALASAATGSVWLGGCTQDPRFVDQDNAPLGARRGKAFVALDVHEYAEGVFRRGDLYDTPAIFANVLLDRSPPYFPMDKWALLNTSTAKQTDRVTTIEAGTYRLTYLGIDQSPAAFGVAASPVEFTVAPGEAVYLGSLAWYRQKTSSFVEFNARYQFEFAVKDAFDAHRDALTQALSALPGAPQQMQTRLMTVRADTVETKEHRPSLW